MFLLGIDGLSSKQVGSQASRRVTRRLAWDLSVCYSVHHSQYKNKQNLKVLKSRRQYNLFLENYPAFKGLTLYPLAAIFKSVDDLCNQFRFRWGPIKCGASSEIPIVWRLDCISAKVWIKARIFFSFDQCYVVYYPQELEEENEHMHEDLKNLTAQHKRLQEAHDAMKKQLSAPAPPAVVSYILTWQL